MKQPAMYLRVSSAEQLEGYSLDAQARALRAYCDAHGWPPPAVYADEGVSAFTDITANRPQFAAMLDAAQRGAHDVILVHKLDRFARSLAVTLRELARLEQSGVAFVSLAEQMDFSTPIGRVILATLAAFAEYYSRNLSAETKKGFAEKRRQGRHVGGIPYGATRIDGRLAIDPGTAATLARILDRCAARDSRQRIADALNAEAIPGPTGGRWWGTAVAHIRGPHGAWLLDQPDPWPERYRAARDRPRLLPHARTATTRMLSGLLRCACGGRISYKLASHPRADGAVVHYGHCRDGTKPGRRGCATWGRTLTQLETLATAWLLALPDPARLIPATTGDDLARRHEDKRRAIIELRRDGLLTDREYEREKAALAALAARLPSAATDVEAVGTGLRGAQRRWDEYDPAERNAFLRAIVDYFLVDRGTIRAVPRPALAELWPPEALVWPR